MKLGVLFSGGKDSTYAAYLAKMRGYTLSCLISMVSKNEDSYMFHTPSIRKVSAMADAMDIPLMMKDTLGEKELELKDLRAVILEAKEKYKIKGIVTGAVGSVYQATRVEKICFELGLYCFNPLWLKNQRELLEEIIKEGFEVIIVGAFAYPLEKDFLGRKIDEDFLVEMETLRKKYDVNVAGEGGEYESLVLNCPLFKKGLNVKGYEDFGEGHSWRREVELE